MTDLLVLRDEIDNLRMYRNGLVHGINFAISQSVIDRVIQIYSAIEAAHAVYKANPRNKAMHDAAIQKIHDLSRSGDTNETHAIQ